MTKIEWTYANMWRAIVHFACRHKILEEGTVEGRWTQTINESNGTETGTHDPTLDGP